MNGFDRTKIAHLYDFSFLNWKWICNDHIRPLMVQLMLSVSPPNATKSATTPVKALQITMSLNRDDINVVIYMNLNIKLMKYLQTPKVYCIYYSP